MGSTVLKENGEAFTTEELTAMKAAIHQHTFNHASRSSSLVLLIFHGVCWESLVSTLHYRRRWLGTTPMGKTMFTKDGLCEFNNSILLASGIAGFTVSSLIHAVGYILILHIYLHILILLMIGCISPWYPTSNGWQHPVLRLTNGVTLSWWTTIALGTAERSTSAPRPREWSMAIPVGYQWIDTHTHTWQVAVTRE